MALSVTLLTPTSKLCWTIQRHYSYIIELTVVSCVAGMRMIQNSLNNIWVDLSLAFFRITAKAWYVRKRSHQCLQELKATQQPPSFQEIEWNIAVGKKTWKMNSLSKINSSTKGKRNTFFLPYRFHLLVRFHLPGIRKKISMGKIIFPFWFSILVFIDFCTESQKVQRQMFKHNGHVFFFHFGFERAGVRRVLMT